MHPWLPSPLFKASIKHEEYSGILNYNPDRRAFSKGDLAIKIRGKNLVAALWRRRYGIVGCLGNA
jgi:hypothetical protein